MQDTSNMLTRWAIALQSFDFTVEHKPGKLHVVPDTLSRVFGDVIDDNVTVLSSQPRLASICRNIPSNGQTHHAPSPRAYEVHADNLDDLCVVESDRELFASAVSVFPTLDPVKSIEGQKSEFGLYFEYISNHDKAPLPPRETVQSASNFFVVDGVLYRSYLPGHLRKRSSFRDQLVVPLVLRPLVMQACHDLPASGGHLAFKATFDRVRDRYYWPTMHKDIESHCVMCEACQRRKTPHRRSPIPIGRVPVQRPFERLAIDLVEYKPPSDGCNYVLSAIDHLTRFVILTAVPNKAAATIARTLVNRVFSVFGVPELLHSDQGTEFENQLVKELQSVFGYKKTRTTPYRPQGNSVLERVHSTMHNMLAMYCDVKHANWAELLPFIQMAHNTAYSRAVHETPHYLMFGRMPKLPVDVIMGMPQTEIPETALQYTRQTVNNLQLAYELARQNLGERAKAQAAADVQARFMQFQPDDLVLVHQPHHAGDDANNKLLSPWRGPYRVRQRLSPVVYRVSRDGQSTETSVHLARMKRYHQRHTTVEPDFEELDQMFLGIKLPLPDLDCTAPSVCIGPRVVERIVDHKRWKGRPGPFNVQFRVRFRGAGPNSDGWYHRRQIPHCHEFIQSYLIANQDRFT